MAKHSNPSRHEIRALQLCRQIQHGVDDFLWCDCCDPLLTELHTIDVTPLNGGSIFLVIFQSPESDPAKLAEIEFRLKIVKGAIRQSVGGSIHRKRVPQLCFQVITYEYG